jgi:hypothetical protein
MALGLCAGARGKDQAPARQPAQITQFGADYRTMARTQLRPQNGGFARDGRDQRSSRCASGVPEGERTERRLRTRVQQMEL